MHGRGRGRLRGDRNVPVIRVLVNGKPVQLDSATPLTRYLEQLGVNPRAVAVEHNGEVVDRAGYANVVLRDGDRLEIVRMVGGGLAQVRRRTAAP